MSTVSEYPSITDPITQPLHSMGEDTEVETDDEETEETTADDETETADETTTSATPEGGTAVATD